MSSPTEEDDEEVRNTTYWITGYYICDDGSTDDEDGPGYGHTFSYGPFPTQEKADERAADTVFMRKALVGPTKEVVFEIADVGPMHYGQACKHFWETIQSEWFRDWYENGWRADDGRIRKQRVA